MPQTVDLPSLAEEIQLRCKNLNQSRALLVAISGIDASGKGYVTQQLAGLLGKTGLQIANIGIDPWQNLPHVRLSDTNPGPHFYHNAMRFEALFNQLILPLKQQRFASVTMDYMEQTANEFRSYTYQLENIDIILLEGIFLFQSRWFQEFDVSVWVECREATALRRAMARNQEGLAECELITEYHKIYFPAQHYHKQRDQPRELAEFSFDNDVCTLEHSPG